uniref:Uncharacterized protein n=1 Tax=Arundo donax TaxID=35708 RepID=A0A0A9RIU5_ARUDO
MKTCVGLGCRAPFNPKSGQQGADAAPRSCRPQAYLKSTHHLSLSLSNSG